MKSRRAWSWLRRSIRGERVPERSLRLAYEVIAKAWGADDHRQFGDRPPGYGRGLPLTEDTCPF